MQDIIIKGLSTVATTSITELVKNLITVYIKPKLETYSKEADLENYLTLIEYSMKEYLEKSYEESLIMNTIVFNNQPKKINDLYIPLTIIKYDSMNKLNSEKYLINGYRDDLLTKYRKILLVDKAGMGKSTIIKYLYLSVISENKGIPLLIELRRLSKEISIIDFIIEQINLKIGLKNQLKKECILQLIELGDFIFFFDGYDEISQDLKKDVTENLQNFILKASCNKFIIASRAENELNCFGDFQRFDINPLTKDEAYELIKKYDGDSELSKELIEKLENEENLKIIKEFLENPLMVSLLYRAFEYKKVIPYKKYIFYRQVYNALFEEHDLSKKGAYNRDKKSKLDIEDFHRVLRAIGFITLPRGTNYLEEELIDIINKAKQIFTVIDFKEVDYLNDLIHSIPLFVKEGIEYKWIHKSFQEYFAANYICFDAKEKESNYLKQMIDYKKIQKYYNVLDFCYDIGTKEFRKTIIYPIIKEYISFYENSYLDNKYKKYNDKYLDIRKSINFIFRYVYLRKCERNTRGNLEISECTKDINLVHRQGVTTSENFDIQFLFGPADRIALLELLMEKKLSIINNIGEQYIGSPKLIESKLEYNKIYIIDEDYSNCFNNSEFMFDETTKFLSFIVCDLFKGRYNLLVLNYNKCLELKNQIEVEIDSHKEDIFL